MIVPFTVFVADCPGGGGRGVMIARRRSTQQDSLLWILAIAAERGMPLAPTVAAFADQYGGKYRRRIMNLAAQLDSGCSVPEALERVPRVVSRDARAAGPRRASRPAGCPRPCAWRPRRGPLTCRSGRPSPAGSPTCCSSC